MRSLASRIDKKDPSRTKAVENARAKVAEKDLKDVLARINDRVASTRATTPAQIQAIVDSELAAYQRQATEKGIAWVNETAGRSVLRADQLMKASGMYVFPSFGPQPISQFLKDSLTLSVKNNMEDLTTSVKKKVTEQLIKGVNDGLGPKVVAKNIAEKTGMERSRAVAIARTETMKAHVSAATDRYKKYGIGKVEWLVANDDRLCDVCAALDGKVYPMDDHPDCPNHVNCRCILMPYIDEEAAAPDPHAGEVLIRTTVIA